MPYLTVTVDPSAYREPLHRPIRFRVNTVGQGFIVMDLTTEGVVSTRDGVEVFTAEEARVLREALETYHHDVDADHLIVEEGFEDGTFVVLHLPRPMDDVPRTA